MAALLAVAVVTVSCGTSPSVTSSANTTTAPKSTTTAPLPPPNIPDDATAGPLGTIQGGALAVPAPTGQTVSIPSTIAADCSQDVSKPLKKWLNQLPANSTVLVSAQACYQVDKALKLKKPTGLTIYGGTFTNDVNTPSKKNSLGQYVFDVVGGSNITLESMKINGQNPGGYDPKLAFAGGIDFEGTAGITITGVTISNTFGDGITLSPLRGGADNNSGTILAPPKKAVIQGVSISGAGRHGIAIASASGVQVSNLIVQNPGIDTIDIEADQHNEGADNVTIDGCTSSGGGIFFANGGSGAGQNTHDLTVAHCSMAKPQGGDAILVYNRGGSRHLRGPIHFIADYLYCGSSVYVACVQLSGASLTIENSVLQFPQGTIHEAVYHITKKSDAVFTNDDVTGFGETGRVLRQSVLEVNGGHWRSVTGATTSAPSKSKH
jgi:hypothetical protein